MVLESRRNASTVLLPEALKTMSSVFQSTASFQNLLFHCDLYDVIQMWDVQRMFMDVHGFSMIL